jgi:hypothetical protein
MITLLYNIFTKVYSIQTLPYVFVMLFLSAQNTCYAQNPNNHKQVIDNIVEDIIQNTPKQTDLSEITDNLYYFINNPININSTSYKTLEKLMFLNVFQIKNLLYYIDKHNGLSTIYELQLIEGFDKSTIIKLLPFITISNVEKTNKWQLNNALKYGKHTIFSRASSILEMPKGFIDTDSSYKNNYYLGNRLHIYNRYIFNYKNNLQWGFTTDKDPGEEFLTKNQPYGFDFYSAFLQINNVGIIKTAIIGDYQVKLGQGLIMWSYINYSKSAYVLNIKKTNTGINRYTSSDENAFLRGTAFTIERNQFSFTGFVSYKGIDAHIISDNSDNIIFSSFLNTGIHAVESDLRNKNSIKETLFGGNINWNYNNIKIGISGLRYFFNKPYMPTQNIVNKFKFKGDNNSNISINTELNFNSINIFGEFAVSENMGKAILAGMTMELTPKISTSVLYRNYTKDYQALYSNAFAEGTLTQNEEGFYMGIILHPIKNWKLSGYYDFYKSPWLKQQVYAPSKGNDYFLQIDFIPYDNLSMYCRYKSENKNININEGIFNKLSTANKSLLRYHISYRISDNWEFRNRIEFSNFFNNNDDESGYLLYQDIIYHSLKQLSISFRYTIFDTESYNTRIYAYENDILNVFSVPALFYKGTRAYIMFKFNISNKLDLWLRFAQTRYNNKTTIGSGLNLINGNLKSDIKCQIRYKF